MNKIAMEHEQVNAAMLLHMLETRRPAGTKSEAKWINRFIRPFGMEQDKAGNLFKRIGDAPIMWSAHTDTVHKEGGSQKLCLSGDLITVAKPSNCLGADDTAGCWLLCAMMAARVPGLYIFHRGEEKGGVGSSWLVENRADIVDGIDAAIAFDRRGTKSIITHQRSGRTCSDAFGLALGDTLGLGHALDDGGTFTDTANYVDLVGECTNVSAGFNGEHTSAESLDVKYLINLRDALLSVDLSNLPIKRRPGEVEPFEKYGNWRKFAYTGTENDFYHDPWEPRDNSHRSLLRIIEDHPEEVADFLEEYGVDAAQLAEAVYVRGAAIKTYR